MIEMGEREVETEEGNEMKGRAARTKNEMIEIGIGVEAERGIGEEIETGIMITTEIGIMGGKGTGIGTGAGTDIDDHRKDSRTLIW